MLGSKLTAILALLAAGGVYAHPGHDIAAEARKRAEFVSSLEQADTSHCAKELHASGLTKRLIARRTAQVKALRRERNLDHRKTHLCQPNIEYPLTVNSSSHAVATRH